VNNVGDDTTNPTGGIIDSTTVTDFAFHDFPQPFESFSVADGDVEAGQQMTLIRTDPQFVEFGPQPVPFIQVDFKNKTNVVVYGSQLDNTTTLANSHPAFGMQNLTIDPGIGTDTVVVEATAAGVNTEVTSDGGNDRVIVGVGGSLTRIKGPLYV